MIRLKNLIFVFCFTLFSFSSFSFEKSSGFSLNFCTKLSSKVRAPYLPGGLTAVKVANLEEFL